MKFEGKGSMIDTVLLRRLALGYADTVEIYIGKYEILLNENTN
jgi:hypothetical protein